jgi:F420-non-reducing hydrogenase small subunit
MSASRKIGLNLEWLSDCGGCHVAIVDVHEKILDILGAVQIQHCPVLTDIKDYPHADIGIISGAIRTEHDRHVAQEMRASCDRIIAWGTCAIYGGIPGAALAHSREEILEAVYTKNPTTNSKKAPCSQVALLEKRVIPLDEVIDVDMYLPGCPPHAVFIFDALLALVEGRTPKARQEPVCARCTRSMKKSGETHLKSNHDGIPDPDLCLLSQGYVCLGSVTLDRCLSPCPGQGVMCTGCAGPTMQILTEPHRDLRTEVADRMSRLTEIPREEIVASMERSGKSHYAYAMASRMVGEKPTFLIRKWIAEVEEEA